MDPYRETEGIYQLEYDQTYRPDPWSYAQPHNVTTIVRLTSLSYKEAKTEAIDKCREINQKKYNGFSSLSTIINARIKHVLVDEILIEEGLDK